MDWKILRMQIITATGWTFEYVDQLDHEQVMEWLGFQEGVAEANGGSN